MGIQAATALLCVLSGVLTLSAWALSRRRTVRWLVVLIGPFTIAAAMYRSPVFLDDVPPSELAHWSVIFIGIWGVSGLVTSLLVATVWTILRGGNW